MVSVKPARTFLVRMARRLYGISFQPRYRSVKLWATRAATQGTGGERGWHHTSANRYRKPNLIRNAVDQQRPRRRSGFRGNGQAAPRRLRRTHKGGQRWQEKSNSRPRSLGSARLASSSRGGSMALTAGPMGIGVKSG